jgi:DNA polymerase III subunit alpha
MPEKGKARYVPLHCHSYYSLFDGLDSPETIAETAANLGFPAVALTDHGTCGGLFSFQKACEKNGIKPILGMETYIVDRMSSRDKDEDRWHLVLLAKDQIGYRNLIRLSTLAYTNGFYNKPRIDFDTLSSMGEGLIATSACAHGVVCGHVMAGNTTKAVENASAFKDLFGDDFYIEIMNHSYNPSLSKEEEEQRSAMLATMSIAKDLGIKCVYTCDSHYSLREDSWTHDVILCISTKDTIKNPNRKMSFGSSDFYMKSWEEIEAEIVRKGGASIVANTLEVAEKVSSGLIKPSKTLLPKFPLPQGVDNEEDFLRQLIRDGMIRKGIYNKRAYRERITEELEVITKCGFVSYFLVLWDIISHARSNDIRVGPGRGSGVASLCLYCLGVTALDPIKHDLLFSRFLNPDRISPPDVDVDFDFMKQAEMFMYVSDKYGQECTSRIGTYGSLKAKDAIKRAGKALDIGNDWEAGGSSGGEWKSGKNTLSIVDEISKAIPFGVDMTIDKAVKESEEIKGYSEKYPQVFKVARKIEGSLSNCGVHPAGMVVCNQPVSDVVPLRVTNDVVCTQFDMHEVEEMGLLKFDFLALKTLSIVDNCLAMIKSRHGKVIDIDSLDPSDPNVFQLFNERDIEGVFQFEGYGISKLLMDLHVDSFGDLVAGVALFRPGPMDLIPDYCDYKHKRKPIEYVHPIMKELLGDTYGMAIYQEGVMAISMKMAGFTPVEADKFRKGMGKKLPEVLAAMEGKFVSGCVKNGVDQLTAQKVFALCKKFAGYGFNKSHAAAYALLAYQTAWLKCYYRPEFMCALLTFSSSSQDEEKRVKYEKNARDKGIRILPPDINKSGNQYKIEDGEKISLRSPLNSIKGIGDKAVESIVSGQPFHGLKDFLAKVDGTAVNSSVFTTLVDAGCMKPWRVPVEDLKKDFVKAREIVRKSEKASRYLKKFDDDDMFKIDV